MLSEPWPRIAGEMANRGESKRIASFVAPFFDADEKIVGTAIWNATQFDQGAVQTFDFRLPSENLSKVKSYKIKHSSSF